jgi:hypothetical protein
MGGTVYTAGASYTVTGDVTLTARWAFSNASDITAYLSGSAANPIPLPAGLNLADSANGWNALFGVISSATPSGQYVALDLSISTISGTEFNPALSAATGKDKIVSLVLPDTALSIANGSSSNATFKDFTSLKRVSGDGLTGVGQYAFYYCTSLAEVSLPAAASIGEYAFQYCTSLAEVSLPAAASIGHMAFYSCTSLTEVSLPAVTTLGNYVFDSTGVTTLTITMGSTPPTVGAVSFYNVTVTKNVTVKVPSTALSLYDTTWQDDFKIGSSINLSIEPL